MSNNNQSCKYDHNPLTIDVTNLCTRLDKYVLIVPKKFDCNRIIVLSSLYVISDNSTVSFVSSENMYIHIKNHFSYHADKKHECVINIQLKWSYFYIENLIDRF